jgi:hypothetical protein
LSILHSDYVFCQFCKNDKIHSCQNIIITQLRCSWCTQCTHEYASGISMSRTSRSTSDCAWYTSDIGVNVARDFFSKHFRIVNKHVVGFKVVCPAAGTGRLTRGFIQAALFDCKPSPRHGVAKADYTSLDLSGLGNTIVFENPPFGQHHAVRVFNCMAQYDNVKHIVFLFPDRFRADQLSSDGRTHLHPQFECVDYAPLPVGSFESCDGINPFIKCSVQLWSRQTKVRGHSLVRCGSLHVLRTDRPLWVSTNLDPNIQRNKSTRRRCCITSTKRPKSFPVAFQGMNKDLLLRALIHCRSEYDYSKTRLHPGNLAATFLDNPELLDARAARRALLDARAARRAARARGRSIPPM